jgi:hypothetical protein
VPDTLGREIRSRITGGRAPSSPVSSSAKDQPLTPATGAVTGGWGRGNGRDGAAGGGLPGSGRGGPVARWLCGVSEPGPGGGATITAPMNITSSTVNSIKNKNNAPSANAE